MSDEHRRPKAFVIDQPEQVSVKTEMPKRKPRAITGIIFEPEELEGDLIVLPPAKLPRSRRIRWGSILIGALLSLVTLGAGLAVTQLIEEFYTRSPLLGWVTLGVAGLAGFAALAIIAREVWALARLRRIESIQIDAAHAINTDDSAAAKRAVSQLQSLYSARADAQLGLKDLKQYDTDIMDGRDRIKLVERYLVSPRDDDAHRICHAIDWGLGGASV